MNHDPEKGLGRRELLPPDETPEDYADRLTAYRPDPHGREADFAYDPLARGGFE